MSSTAGALMKEKQRSAPAREGDPGLTGLLTREGDDLRVGGRGDAQGPCSTCELVSGAYKPALRPSLGRGSGWAILEGEKGRRRKTRRKKKACRKNRKQKKERVIRVRFVEGSSIY